ncbi:MAG: zinc ABC transporter substrate-binding protein [Defluviicoccus sp.]|nr:MAG: zinc ABC transporter substrate-binding protein [Defluviicoccus sp.]
MLKPILAGILVAFGLAVGHTCLASAPPEVVVSIKPIHSLVAAVMDGSAEPTLLVPSGASPHTYSLRPSDARALQSSDLVFWVGDGLETFLQKPLAALVQQARVVELVDTPGLTLLPYRSNGPWEAHVHGSAAHDEGDDDDEHDHGRDEDPGHEHAHGIDMHIWLDAGNAETIVHAVATALASADPDRAPLYAANADRTVARLKALDGTLHTSLAPLAGRPYIVFHDAYQYIEHRYGLTPAGSITVSPERQPGAQRVAAIRRKIIGLGAVCVFSEPQFQPALVQTLIEDTPARTGVLDPIGGPDVSPGPQAYFTMMQTIVHSIRECLAPGS